MRRILLALLLALPVAPLWAAGPQLPGIAAHSWILLDLSSGQVLGAEKADERVEPASLTKLMTAYLVFAALRDGKLSRDQTLKVSERAWKAPGSRMFIQPGLPVAIEQLIRGMVVQSGNDASVALAEAVAGSEELFAQLMNREAERLGLKSTQFANSSGLPDPRHYSTARDLAMLAAALIRDFPEPYAQYYAQKEFRYNNITQLNRNRLLWLDPSIDGVKTGHTEAAGYCLIASSKRGPRRLVSVVLGSTSEAARALESQKLLNWGFQFFDSVRLYGGNQPVRQLEVWKGAADKVGIGVRSDLVVSVPKGEAAKLTAELLAAEPLVAPVGEGQRVGTLRVALEGRALGEFPVVALQPVAAAGVLGRAWDTLRLWIR